jgi:hypothetical protein
MVRVSEYAKSESGLKVTITSLLLPLEMVKELEDKEKLGLEDDMLVTSRASDPVFDTVRVCVAD